MSQLHYLHDEIAVVGWSCRVPGANSVERLWPLLLDGRCAVSTVPPDRWSLSQYGHPRRKERGKSYTWSAGIIDDVWGFDPSLFGISPREAQQMDPQQRILLELTWEALEDAGIKPSSIAGDEVGVYVGGSTTDYANARWGDPAGGDSYFATGNALSILANRISYVFDLRGPSVTIDTACSSSLVALHHAVEALNSGRIDMAVVGGINVLASPYSFISFSQATMLSPTGLCRAFSADADGYVRAEGGAVVVLRKASQARTQRNPIHGLILASDVNSDGRTNGISLPSGDAQAQLLQRVYGRSEIDPNQLAFLEAHGTGTPVGDPTEAAAVGRVLGCARAKPLTIGSIKTNIGHLESASGVVGLLKALLSLDHGMLPPSLHAEKPNPKIDFARLNLEICRQPLPLPDASRQYAGVNSFGFGGTNAHVVVGRGQDARAHPQPHEGAGGGFFTLSAESHAALVDLARTYAERLARSSDEEADAIARAAAHRRERLSMRLVISGSSSPKDIVEGLTAYVAGQDDPRLTSGTALGDGLPVAFVYSGNGSQWIGMGIAAYRDSAAFRAHFDELDEIFRALAGWSLREMMFSEALAEQLRNTSIAQPLIFAIQSATTAALRLAGLRPAIVLGHSVGEVAAIEAAGILDRHAAMRVIHARSTFQELVRDHGRMVAVIGTRAAVDQLLQVCKNLSIAAYNSGRALTLAGSTEAIADLKGMMKRQRVVFRDLDLDYPFHTPLMAPVQAPLCSELKGLQGRSGDVQFVSTVTGTPLSGTEVGADYWWRNVREPVQFQTAIHEAVRLGARTFVEIGPRSTLRTHIADNLDKDGRSCAILSVLDRNRDDDPIGKAIASAIAWGAQLDDDKVFGPDPGTVPLPTYPWQHSEFRNSWTPEAIGYTAEPDAHPLCGSRVYSDGLEWHAHVDTAVMPELGDHKVGQQVILAGAAFLEIALAAAQNLLNTPNVSIVDFAIAKPLDLTGGETRELLTRVSPMSNTVEIMSRPRLSGAAWLLHARGKIFHANSRSTVADPVLGDVVETIPGEVIYRLAGKCGLSYGPAFRLVQEVTRSGPSTLAVELTAPAGAASNPKFRLDPMRLDACLHGLFVLFARLQAESRGVSFIPVRFDELTYFAAGSVPQRAVIEVGSSNERAVVSDFCIYGSDGELLAVIRGAHFQAIPVRRTAGLDSIALVEQTRLLDGRVLGQTGVGASAAEIVTRAQVLDSERAPPNEGHEDLILEGWAMAMAYEIASGLSGGGEFNPELLVGSGHLSADMLPWMRNILFSLEGAGLAKEAHGRWTLLQDPLLPASASVLKAIATEHPARAAELFLASELSGLARGVAAERRLSAPVTLSNDALDYYAVAGVWSALAGEFLSRLTQRVKGLWSIDRAVRVLQIGFGPLTRTLMAMAQAQNIHLTVLEPDRRRFEHAKLELSGSSDVRLLDLQQSPALGEHDLIVATESLHRLPASMRLASLNAALAPRGLLVAVEPRQSLFRDLVFGLSRGWFDRSYGGFPVGSLRSDSEWQQALEEAGFAEARTSTITIDSEPALLIAAQRSAQPTAAAALTGRLDADGPTTLIVTDPRSSDHEIASTLATLLPGSGAHVGMVMEEFGEANLPELAADVIVLFLSEPEDGSEAIECLRNRCLEIKSCAERVGSGRATLWIVFTGALTAEPTKIIPVEVRGMGILPNPRQ